MNTKRFYGLMIPACLLALLLYTAGGSTDTDVSSLEVIPLPSFAELHAPVAGSDNGYLVLGNIRQASVAKKVPDKLARLAGRWEGYDLSPPVKNDLKMVIVVQKITPEAITFVLWQTTNLQQPAEYMKIQARVTTRDPYTFEAAAIRYPDQYTPCTIRLTYDETTDRITGEITRDDGEPIRRWVQGGEKLTFTLSRAEKFIIYQDYAAYLNGKSIYTKEYERESLAACGKGYMYYLPEDYSPDRKYPLMVFFHGMGDRGENIDVLAKASPFMYIREQEDLPMIIAAPLLRESGSRYFSLECMEDFLSMMISEYNVDESRICLTGLSMGGEAVWRFALNHPDQLAALAVLAAPLHRKSQFGSGHTIFPLVEQPLSVLRDLPVRIIHGADDALIPPGGAEENYRDLQAVGGNVSFSLLAGHDHDVWTTTYSDPAFYAWLLKQKR